MIDYLLHICFDSVSGTELKVSLLIAHETPYAIPWLWCREQMWLTE